MKATCIYLKSFYYACVYMVLVVFSFFLGFANNYFEWKFAILDIIGFSALVMPTVPFQGLLLKYNMLISDGVYVVPTDMGLLVTHSIWFTFFYVTYFVFLAIQKKCKTKTCCHK